MFSHMDRSLFVVSRFLCDTKKEILFLFHQPDTNFKGESVHSKTPNVVTVLWLDSDDVVTILSSTRNLVEGYKTVYLCHLDS